MKRLPLIVALAAGLVGMVLLETYKARFEAEVTGGELVDVLSVKRDFAIGQRLDPGDVSVDTVPARFVDRRRVRASDLKDIVGARTSAGLVSGDALHYEDLALANAEARDLSSLVPDGLRAVSVQATTFDGLLRPGDRVDVLHVPSVEGGDARASVLLQRALVLAVGGKTTSEATRDSGSAVVLAMSTEEAAELALALRAGRVMLALRHPGDLVTLNTHPTPPPAVEPSKAKPREVERVR